MTQLSDFEEFVGVYNAVDNHMRKVLGVDHHVDHSTLIKMMCNRDRAYNLFADELRTMAQLRNVLVHNPYMQAIHPLATPNSDITKRYKALYDKMVNPIIALAIAVPGAKIYSAKLTDSTLAVIKTMAKNTYTHVPIIDDGKMIGVFSENTLLTFLAHEEEAIITRDLQVADFVSYIPFDRHDSEKFIFIQRSTSLHDVIERFNKALAEHVRIGAIFITEHGKPKEKLLGLITAWDIANVELK